METVKQVKCPVCEGSGKLPMPNARQNELIKQKRDSKRKGKRPHERAYRNAIMAKLLRAEGYSFQEIANFLGFRSKAAVTKCLARNTEPLQPEPESIAQDSTQT